MTCMEIRLNTVLDYSTPEYQLQFAVRWPATALEVLYVQYIQYLDLLYCTCTRTVL